MSLLHLPNELIFQISELLNPVDLYTFLRVNRALFYLLYDSLLDTACNGSHCSNVNCAYEHRSCNLIRSAAQRGDKELVKLVISKGILNVVDPHRLLVRVLRRRKCNDALRLLLECGAGRGGACPDYYEEEFEVLPLGYTVTHGKAKALEIMLDTNDVDVNEYLIEYPYERVTLLHLAVEHRQLAVVRMLLTRKDIDVNRLGLTDNCTPLYHAVCGVYGSEDITRVLLADPRVDVNCLDTDLQTPLHAAADIGAEQLLKILLAHPKTDPNICDKFDQSALHFAARFGDCRLVRLFLKDERLSPAQFHGARGNPLHTAAWNGQFPALRLLLEDGRFDINATDERGDTPLHIVIRKGDREDLVLLLLSREGVDVEIRNREGKSSRDLVAAQNRLILKRAMEKYLHGKREHFDCLNTNWACGWC